LVCKTQLLLPQFAPFQIPALKKSQQVFDPYDLATPTRTDSARNRLISVFSIDPYKSRMNASTSLILPVSSSKQSCSRLHDILEARGMKWDAMQLSQNC
jgi:hypothetical protein